MGSLLTVDGGRRVDEHTDSLTQARKAHAARDWATAAAHFDAVLPDRLAADDLAAYADAVWWLGRIDDNLRLNAAACDALLAESRPADAAWAALVLGIFHMSRGDEPLGMGWMGRAGRLAEGISECPVHGWLLLLTEVEPSLTAGRPTAAVDAARRMRDIARRLHVARAARGRHPQRGPRPDQIRPRGRRTVAARRGDGHCPRRQAGPVHHRHPLLPHHCCLPRGCRRPPDDSLDRAGRAVAGHIPRGGGVRGSLRGAQGSAPAHPRQGGTTPSAQRCRSCRTSMPTGSTTPPRPGMSWPRRDGCVATRAPPARMTRRTPADATRSRDARYCSSRVATPRGPRRRSARP